MRSRSVAVLAILMAALACEPDVGLRRDDPGDGQVTGDGLGTPLPASASEDAGADLPVSFRRDLRPILARSDGPPAGCRRCHYRGEPAAQGTQIGGLDLTTLGTLRMGGISSGRDIVVPGDPERSVLIQKLEGTYARGARMPKDLTPLSRAEIDLFRRWIAQGAPGADDE